jgi:signal transduction histidine kinase
MVVPEAPSGARDRVLVVDDSAELRALIVELLSPSYEVEAVEDGTEALRAIRRQPPDVVLCDVMMPGIDGFEVVRRLKADPELRSIPVILVTARAGRREVVAGLDAGADDYLPKPFEPAELHARVHAALRLRHQFLLLARKHHELELAHRALGDLQTELVQAAKLAAIGQFTAGISHTLNNPLATILLQARSLLRQVPEDSPLRPGLSVVQSAAERCRAVMRTVPDLARTRPTRIGPASVLGILESVGTVARAQARPCDVTVVLEAVPEWIPEVEVDAQGVEGALLHVVANALEATPAGGRVTLRAAPTGGRWVELSVTDTGPGIPDDVLPHLFEPFFTTRGGGSGLGLGFGLGLGLPLARRMVSESGGTIDVESRAGQGTRVRIRLPAAEAR